MGLGALALLILGWSAHALQPPPRVLGHARSCAEAQRIDGRLHCEEELHSSTRSLCARAAVSVLRPGDAVERAQVCSGLRPARMQPAELRALAQTVDLNRASAEELASLPGVGETIAARIVARRPYTQLEQLLEVRGIGALRLERLRARARIAEPR